MGDLLAVSPALKNLKDDFDLQAKKCRIVIHPDLEGVLGEDIEKARMDVRMWLRDHFDSE